MKKREKRVITKLYSKEDYPELQAPAVKFYTKRDFSNLIPTQEVSSKMYEISL